MSDNLLSVLVLGISYGLVMFLLASGMTLTMGLLRVVNMSHGAIYMFAGYCGVWIYQMTGNWVLALLAGGAVGALLGLLLETAFLRRLYKTPANQVLLTIGFIYILQNVTQWIWGGLPASVPTPPFLEGGVEVGAVTIPYFRFFIIGFGVVMAALIWLLQDRTKVGAMVRAGMDNGEIAGTLGMNIRTIFTLVFLIGSMVAGLSSMVGGGLTGLNSTTCWNVLLNAIIVVVIGGSGSIPGALLGGLLIGLVNAFGTAYAPALSSYAIYLVLIVVLVIRPQGFMGRKIDVDKAADNYSNFVEGREPVFTPRMLGETPGAAVRRKLKAYNATPYCFVLLLLVVMPLLVGNYTTSILTKVLVYALFAMSLDVVMGYTGNRSFGHAAYFGMGAYLVALLFMHLQITSFWLVLPIVIVVCAALAAVIGYFTLRLSGTNFLLVTMAFGQLLSVIASKWNEVTNGTDGISGISRPVIFGIKMTTKYQTNFYFFVLILFVICFVILYRIVHSSFGKTLLAIRGNESRMRALGNNTWLSRYVGILIAGVFAGIAGLLYAYTYQTVVPNLFALETSALPMLMVIMGGGATLWGPALGAAVIILVQNYAGIWLPERWPLILGGLYIVCVMFLPGGFAPLLQQLWDRAGTWVFKKELAKARGETPAGEEEAA